MSPDLGALGEPVLNLLAGGEHLVETLEGFLGQILAARVHVLSRKLTKINHSMT